MRVRYPDIHITYYDTSGRVWGCVSADEVYADYLDPGQETPFLSRWINYDEIYSYQIQGTGLLPGS